MMSIKKMMAIDTAIKTVIKPLLGPGMGCALLWWPAGKPEEVMMAGEPDPKELVDAMHILEAD